MRRCGAAAAIAGPRKKEEGEKGGKEGEKEGTRGGSGGEKNRK